MVTHIADQQEYRNELLTKLFEEFEEVEAEVKVDNRADIVKELADLTEVLNAVHNEMTVGGIDFNPDEMDLMESGEAFNFALDNSMLQTLEPDAVHGIRSVIINITPVLDYLPLLGLSDEGEQEERQQLSRM